MKHFPRPVIKRAREHLLHTLRGRSEVSFSRTQTGASQALLRADDADSAWYWPETLIHDAAEQLRRAGIVDVVRFHEGLADGEPVLQITVTARDEAFLRSGKPFRCRTNSQKPSPHQPVGTAAIPRRSATTVRIFTV